MDQLTPSQVSINKKEFLQILPVTATAQIERCELQHPTPIKNLAQSKVQEKRRLEEKLCEALRFREQKANISRTTSWKELSEPKKILSLFNLKSDDVIDELSCKTLSEIGIDQYNVERWNKIPQIPKENLYELLRRMIEDVIKPNVQIIIGGIAFNCHLMVLQAYSEVFAKYYTETVIYLEDPTITAASFMMAYDWMVADRPLLQRDGIIDLLNTANKLKIPTLVQQCWSCLDSKEVFVESSAFMLYLESQKYDMVVIRNMMFSRIYKFFLTLVSSHEYALLDIDDVCELLSLNTIGVNSETEVFMSAIRWLYIDWEQRKDHAVSLLKCVRFTMLPPWFLIILAKDGANTDMKRIAHLPEVQRLINDGITYNTAIRVCGEKSDFNAKFLDLLRISPPAQRQWIYDKNCPYHLKTEGISKSVISYRSFLAYLKFLQSASKEYYHSYEILDSPATSMDMPFRIITAKEKLDPPTEIQRKSNQTAFINAHNEKLMDNTNKTNTTISLRRRELLKPGSSFARLPIKQKATKPSSYTYKRIKIGDGKYNYILQPQTKLEKDVSKSEKQRKMVRDIHIHNAASQKKTDRPENTLLKRSEGGKDPIRHGHYQYTNQINHVGNIVKHSGVSEFCIQNERPTQELKFTQEEILVKEIEIKINSNKLSEDKVKNKDKPLQILSNSPVKKSQCRQHAKSMTQNLKKAEESNTEKLVKQSKHMYNLLYQNEESPNENPSHVKKKTFTDEIRTHGRKLDSTMKQQQKQNSQLCKIHQIVKKSSDIHHGTQATSRHCNRGGCRQQCIHHNQHQPDKHSYAQESHIKCTQTASNQQNDHIVYKLQKQMHSQKQTIHANVVGDFTKGKEHLAGQKQQQSEEPPKCVNTVQYSINEYHLTKVDSKKQLQQKQRQISSVSFVIDQTTKNVQEEVENENNTCKDRCDLLTSKYMQYKQFPKLHEKQERNVLRDNATVQNHQRCCSQCCLSKNKHEEFIETKQTDEFEKFNLMDSELKMLHQNYNANTIVENDECVESPSILNVQRNERYPLKFIMDRSCQYVEKQNQSDEKFEELTEPNQLITSEMTSNCECVINTETLFSVDNSHPEDANLNLQKNENDNKNKQIHDGEPGFGTNASSNANAIDPLVYEYASYASVVNIDDRVRKNNQKTGNDCPVIRIPQFQSGNNNDKHFLRLVTSLDNLKQKQTTMSSIDPKEVRLVESENSIQRRNTADSLTTFNSKWDEEIELICPTNTSENNTKGPSEEKREARVEYGDILTCSDTFSSSDDCSLPPLPEKHFIELEMPTSVCKNKMESVHLAPDTTIPSKTNQQCVLSAAAAYFNFLPSPKVIVFGGIDRFQQRNSHLQQVLIPASESLRWGNKVLCFDSIVQQWKYLTDMPFGIRHHHVIVQCNGLFYIIGGTGLDPKLQTTFFDKKIWSFDPKTLSWECVAELPEIRRDFAAVAVDEFTAQQFDCNVCNKNNIGFYIIGGQDSQKISMNSVLFFNVITKMWKKKPPLEVARYGHMAALVATQIWVGGGIKTTIKRADDGKIAPDKNIMLDSMEYLDIFNTQRPSWIKTDIRLLKPIAYGKFWSLPPKSLYLIGGVTVNDRHEYVSVRAIDHFIPCMCEWHHIGDLQQARHDHDVNIYKNKFIILGGISNIDRCSLKSVELFSLVECKSLKNLPDLPWPVSGCGIACVD